MSVMANPRAPDASSPGAAPLPPLIAGALCLELCNTIARRHTDAPVEHLSDYPTLLRWALGAGALDARAAEECRRAGERRPGRAQSALAVTRELRTAMHAAFLAAAERRPADPHAVAVLDGHVRRAFAARTLVAAPSGAQWGWVDTDVLMRPLWPVALSAAALLTSADLVSVRECAGRANGCGWLFLDAGRGGGRRWCAMELCGNRAKARRHHRRAQRR
jgi:predicted RNA-binding Zn ribbon-like protein